MSGKSLVFNANDQDKDCIDAEPKRSNVYTTEGIAPWYDGLYTVFCVVIYIADVVTDMLVSGQYFTNGDYIWGSLTLACVVGASLVMMTFSLKWYYDDTDEQVSKTKTVVLHALQLGPLIRYWECYKNGKRSKEENADRNYYSIYLEQWRDIAMLRLFEVFVESAPQLVLQLYILAYNRQFDKEKDWLTVLSACLSLISLSTSIVSYSKALRDASDDKGKMTWWAFGFQIIWRFSMVASRIVTLVLFASVYRSWILLVIGLHWVAMTIWIHVQRTSFSQDNKVLKVIWPIVIGFIYVFCFLNAKDMTRQRLVLYYALMFVENVALMLAWLPYRYEYGVIFVAALGMVFGGFFLGVIMMVLYYQCYHPSLPRQGICIRTTHDVPRVEGIVYRMICCNTCCRVRSYEDEESATPTGSQLHIDIPASRGSLRRDVARDKSASTSPTLESEILMHKPSQLQKQYSLDKDKNKKERAARARSRQSLEGGIQNGVANSVMVQVPDAVSNSNEIVAHESSPDKNIELNRGSNSQVRNENEMIHTVHVHVPKLTPVGNGHGPISNGSHCDDRVRSGTNHEKKIGTLCDDRVHCGTDDDKETKPPCDDGIHCGTDDEEEIKTSKKNGSTLCDDRVHCGTDDEKETKPPCDDGIHCGTDDEEEIQTSKKNSRTPCEDGVHCGTDDEQDTSNVQENNIGTSFSGIHGDTKLHPGDDHADGACTLPGSYVHNMQTTRKHSDGVNFHHRYSIVSDCISLSSSTSSDNEEHTVILEEKDNLSDNAGINERLLSTQQTTDNNSNLCGPANSASLRRSHIENPKRRTINRRSKQSNRVSFPNFVATNLRHGKYSSLRRSREDCTKVGEDNRRHTVDFSVLTSGGAYDDSMYDILTNNLKPRKFGSVRDEMEKLTST